MIFLTFQWFSALYHLTPGFFDIEPIVNLVAREKLHRTGWFWSASFVTWYKLSGVKGRRRSRFSWSLGLYWKRFFSREEHVILGFSRREFKFLPVSLDFWQKTNQNGYGPIFWFNDPLLCKERAHCFSADGWLHMRSAFLFKEKFFHKANRKDGIVHKAL